MRTWASRGFRKLHLLLLLLLIVLTQLGRGMAEIAPELCPGGCDCNPNWDMDGETVFKAECGRGNWLLEVPDWSPLQGVQGRISLSVYIDQLARLGREDLPSGLDVVALRIDGADRKLQADTFENVGESVEQLEIVFARLELRWSFPFLATLPKLKTLTLQFETEDPYGGVVAGAPFRGLGLDLAMLSIRGGPITGFRPLVFDGLAAEVVTFRQNKLSHLPREALKKVEGLLTLNIFRNPLKRLKDGDTDGLNLTALSITEAPLEDIAEGALTGVKDTLRQLSITECRLQEVPIKALASLQSLEKLEIIDNPISQLDQPLQGDYCLERLRLGGGIQDKRLKSVDPGALAPQKDCLESLLLWETALPEFPTEAFKELNKLRLLSVESSALTRLPAGALEGVGTKTLKISAPLETIEPGAFEGMREYPVDLTLTSTQLQKLSFFYEYKSGTFYNIEVTDSMVACDCELAGVRRNLRLRGAYVGEDWLRGDVNGDCLLGDQMEHLQSEAVTEVFSKCTNITLLDPVDSGGRLPRAGMLPGFLVVIAVLLLLLGRF